MKRDDDTFLGALEEDEEIASVLATAAARPAPAYLRDRIVERHRRRPFAVRLRTAAALAAAVVALVILFDQTQGADLEVAAALADDVRIVHMSPGAAGRGTVVVKKDAQAYLVLDLPAPPPGKAYEAWVIRDGKPLRAGIAPTRGGVVTIRLDVPVRPGDVTAVTLEVASGVDQPTSDPILVGSS